MRSLWNGIVNGIAGLFAANGGAPHPIVATDDVGPAERGPNRSDDAPQQADADR